MALHRNGHEIGCHTFSHRAAGACDAAALETEIATNRSFLQSLDASIEREGGKIDVAIAA